MTAIKRVMEEKGCTYPQAKEMHRLNLEQGLTTEINEAKRGNVRIEEIRQQINARPDINTFKGFPTNEAQINGIINNVVEPSETLRLQQSEAQYLSALEQNMIMD